MCSDVTRGNIVASELCGQHAGTCFSIQVAPRTVRSWFRPRHVIQRALYPLAGYSLRLTIPKRDLSLDPLCHLLHCTTFRGKYDGFTLVRKYFLDFRQLLAGM